MAEWAGHSVDVLLRIYAKCVAGQDELAKLRISEACARIDVGGPAPTAPDRQHASGAGQLNVREEPKILARIWRNEPQMAVSCRTQPHVGAESKIMRAKRSCRSQGLTRNFARWGGWGSNPRPADYENYGPALRMRYLHRYHQAVPPMALIALLARGGSVHKPVHA